MGTIGLIQYVNPSLQFAVAALILSEPVTLWHMIAFPMIWVALAVYSWVSLRPTRANAP
jgi:chloramphenicol-sensitive protein RarD